MHNSPKPMLIGAFIVGTLVLTVTAILIIGSGRFFSKRIPLLLYFAESANGLSVGSAVKFKGVPVGQVTRIQVRCNDTADVVHIPVTIEIDEDVLQARSGDPLGLRDPDVLDMLIQRGLRGSLELESFLTGRLYVGLDIYRKSALPVTSPHEGPHPEIPTISTGFSEFLKSLESVDLGGLAKRLDNILVQLSGILGEVKFKELQEKLVSLLNSVESLTAGPEVKGAVASVKSVADEARGLVADVRAEVKPLAAGMNQTTAEATKTLTDLRQTLLELRQLMDADSPLLGEVNTTLNEFERAARSIRLLADSLSRNPRSLLTGKAAPAQKP